MIIILGYILAVLMGLTLGLIGAGGSILSMPILVYFFKITPITATSYSLLIVGIAALVGALFYHKKNLINFRAAITFIIPAAIAVLCTRVFVVSDLPEKIFQIPKEIFVMLLFSLLMLVAAFFMLRPPSKVENMNNKQTLRRICFLVVASSGIGFLTAMVGAGGGFLIIPTLVILFSLPMKEATGTSLAIIATNSLIGFNGDLLSGLKINWAFLELFIFFTTCGILLGLLLSKKFDERKLRKVFAAFVLIISISVFVNELSHLTNL